MSAVVTEWRGSAPAALGPEQVQAAAEVAAGALSVVLSPSAVLGSREQWAAAVGSVQRVLDVAAAVQDAAIVRLAAIEAEWGEDGTFVETHHALGHVALDAPAILSGVLSASSVHTERRVAAAVLLAADGPQAAGAESGLGGLHAAMGAGRLDPYRAGVIADELEAAPPDVRATVLTLLEPHFDLEDGAHLRRRCRRALARISPDLLRQRALRARRECGLRRWVAEPGVDRWAGTFPSEDAATAWAAIDALAHRYVREGTCTHIEAARGKALTDLVAGQATIDTVLTVTVPADLLSNTSRSAGDREARTADASPTADHAPAPAADPTLAALHDPAPATARHPAPAAVRHPALADGGTDDLVEVTGPAGSQPVLVSRAWVTSMATSTPRGRASRSQRDAAPGSETEVKGRASGAITPDPVDPPEPADRSDPSRRATPASGWRSSSVEVAPCHPRTGALLDPAAESTTPYRPSGRMARRIKARDRRCRFPGCSVAAVFCDLDHVRPWPDGPTADTNLICLCRRHHRVKQRPGWSVVLGPDATVTWTDPTGRVHSTAPADALSGTVVGGAATPPPAPVSTSRVLTDLPDGPHSDLEFRIEHQLAAVPDRCRAGTWRDHSGRRHRLELQPARGIVTVHDGVSWPHHSGRRPGHHGHRLGSHIDDPPPF